VVSGKIVSLVEKGEENTSERYFCPGLVNAHMHVESSMLTPAEFARIAVLHGSVAAVCDPHEIANVMGKEGIEFMISNGRRTPFKFYFGAPSCVPATMMETSGSTVSANDIHELLSREDIYFLGEVMNFPAVVEGEKEMILKLEAAIKNNKKIDGHVPGLTGEKLKQYVEAGISTDHESSTIEEAIAKIELGMKIQIREGSAAKNFTALATLIDLYPDHVMICTDDSHPDDLIQGHLNEILKIGLSFKLNFFNLIRAVTWNPVLHYGIDVGMLREGDAADFIVINNLKEFKVIETYIEGQCVAKNGKSVISKVETEPLNNFNCSIVNADDFRVTPESNEIRVIDIIEGELVTKMSIQKAYIIDGNVCSYISEDVLKIVVMNRYRDEKPAIGFVRNFGLKKGAIASSIAHDSHNIICVGCSDEDMAVVVNEVINNRGGVAAGSRDEGVVSLQLDIAGLMSGEEAHIVASKYHKVDQEAKRLGAKIKAPFMTLSFMSLVVIPEIKICDKGLFDGNRFEFISLFV
jgi:adenine deaminase